MNLRFAALILLLPWPNGVEAQEKSTGAGSVFERLAPGTHEIRVRTSSEDAFEDLVPLGRAVGNSRVVVLGEPNHGSGTAVELRARIVRFLHRHLGFDAIAFEASLFNCHWAWSQVERGGAVRDWIPKALLPVWWRRDGPIEVPDAWLAADARLGPGQ